MARKTSSKTWGWFLIIIGVVGGLGDGFQALARGDYGYLAVTIGFVVWGCYLVAQPDELETLPPPKQMPMTAKGGTPTQNQEQSPLVIPNGFICRECGHFGKAVKDEEGGRSVILFIILLCFMIIPGLLYWGFKSKAKSFVVCPGCNGRNTMVSTATPVGRKLYKELHHS